jgi:hypothetical protein
LLQFGVASTAALGVAAANTFNRHGSSIPAPAQEALRVEEVSHHRQRSSIAVQTDGIYLQTMPNGVPVAVLPSMQECLHASTMAFMDPIQAPAPVLPSPSRAPVPAAPSPAQPTQSVSEDRAVQPSAPPMSV